MKKLILVILAITMAGSQSPAQNQHLIDSLNTQLKLLDGMKSEPGVKSSAIRDSNMVILLNRMSEVYMRNKPELAMDYAKQALNLSEQIDFKSGVSASYVSIGDAHETKGDFLNAMEYYNKAFISYYELGDKRGIAKAYKLIGNIHSNQGNYPEALKNFLASLKLAEESGNKRGMADAYNNIGIVYTMQKNEREAIRYYLATLKINKEMHDSDGIASANMNIGSLYSKQKKLSEALILFTDAIKIFENIGNREFLAGAYINVGVIYSGQKNDTAALRNFLIAKKIAQELGNKWAIAITYINIGGIYTKQLKYKEASEYLNKSLSLAKEMGTLPLISAGYHSLAALDSCTGNHQEEIVHYKLFISTRDSLNNAESGKKIAHMQRQYDLDKEELILKAEKEKEEKAHEHKEQMEYLGIFCLIIFIFGMVLITSRMNISRKWLDFVGFVGVLLLFQFLESVIHPKIYPYIHGSPSLFIVFNVMLASTIKPLHNFTEHRLLAYSARLKEKRKLKEALLTTPSPTNGHENDEAPLMGEE